MRRLGIILIVIGLAWFLVASSQRSGYESVEGKFKAAVSSEEPLSATTTSPVSPAEWNAASALSMQAPIDFSSLRQGITTETSAPAWEVERRETRVVDRWPGGDSICETGFTGTCRARGGLFTCKAVRLPDIRPCSTTRSSQHFQALDPDGCGEVQDSRS